MAPLSPSESETPTPPLVLGETPQITVRSGLITWVYEGPSSNYDSVGSPKWDVPYAVTGRSVDNAWLQITFEGQSAWIRVPSVERVNPSAFGPGGSAIPILTPPPTYTPTPPWLTAP